MHVCTYNYTVWLYCAHCMYMRTHVVSFCIIYVRTYVCPNVHTYVHMYIHRCVCTLKYIRTFITFDKCMHARSYTFQFLLSMYVHTSICIRNWKV